MFKIGATPVPIALAYRPPVDDALAASEAFREAYDTSLGLRVVGDTVHGNDAVWHREGGIIQLPYWLHFVTRLC